MPNTAVQAGAFIHHLAFESADPQRLAEFYGRTMQMDVVRVSETEWRCEGPQRRFVAVKGQDKKLAYAGLGCRDLEAVDLLLQRARAEGLEIFPSPSPYFQHGAFAVRDPDGHLICFGLAKPDGTPRSGIHAPIQHLTFATTDVQAFIDFYMGKLGFKLTDRVLHADGRLATAFATSNHEHHTIACFFKPGVTGVDHHSYEAGEWIRIRDWCDHFATLDIQLMWGPGRHGPGNNLFIFITDPDDNWIEISAELEVIYDREVADWPQHPRTLNLWGNAILRS